MLRIECHSLSPGWNIPERQLATPKASHDKIPRRADSSSIDFVFARFNDEALFASLNVPEFEASVGHVGDNPFAIRHNRTPIETALSILFDSAAQLSGHGIPEFHRAVFRCRSD